MQQSSCLSKNNRLLLKFGIALLLLGLAFRFFYSSSTEFEPDLGASLVDKQQVPLTPPPPPPPPVSVDIPENEDQMPLDVVLECDLFTGKWVENPSGPGYTNESCPLMDGHQNCMRNGRPDSGYLYWKWSPRDCSIPNFDARRFLELMTNKTWALIGDSISRNHVESLLCMLSGVERAAEVYHDEQYRSKRWQFPSFNFTIWNIWSPFLVKAAIFEDFNGVSTSEVQLDLDKLDKTWTDIYQSLDYVIISTGKWFLKAAIYHEKNVAVGCHMCPGKNLTELGFVYAYNKTLHHVMNYIATSNHKGVIFFRTSTPDHFENGEWHNGGNCLKTSPAKEGELQIKDLHRILRDTELAEFEKASEKAAKNGVNLKLLDFTSLLLQRPDGHPGAYREFHPFEHSTTEYRPNDCLHWCLPGPIDSLNDIIMDIVVKG